jgi:hypothetical protein
MHAPLKPTKQSERRRHHAYPVMHVVVQQKKRRESEHDSHAVQARRPCGQAHGTCTEGKLRGCASAQNLKEEQKKPLKKSIPLMQYYDMWVMQQARSPEV